MVRTYAESGAPGYARIEVTNTAPDISPEELPRIFERFYRRDRTRAQGGGSVGSGLGLPIARDLIELHGGTLEARNCADGGACFEFWLPALSDESAPPESGS